jgi:multiple sugar transport system substrate-binding protein
VNIFEKRITRQHFLRGMALAAGSAALAGCGGGSGSSSNEITFMNWEETEGTPLGEVLKVFEKKTGMKVTIQPAPEGDAYDAKMRTVLSSGSPPDVFRINDDFVRGFSKDGALLDLSKYMKKSNLDTNQFIMPSFNFPEQPDGSHTAWVVGIEPRLIYYNVDIFKEAGVALPPTEWTSENWTWDDFLNTAKQLTVKEDQWGGLIYYDTGYEQTFSVNNGDEPGIYSEDGKDFTLASPKGAEAVQWATDLTCEHGVQPPWSQLQQEFIDQQLFAQGKVAMIFGTFGIVPYLEETIKDFTWDVAPPPAKVHQMTEASVIVFASGTDSENPEGAWKLLNFLSSEEAGKILAKGRAFNPINKEAAKLIKPTDQPPAHINLFAEASNYLTAPNQTDATNEARDLYRPALDKVYNCEASAQEVLNSVKPRVEELLAGKM